MPSKENGAIKENERSKVTRQDCGQHSAACHGTEPCRYRGRWIRLARCAEGWRTVPWFLPLSTVRTVWIAETVINCEGAAAFAKLNRDGGFSELAQQENNSWPNIFRVGSLIPAADYIQAMRLRHRLQREWAEAMGDFDGFITAPFSGPTLTYTNLTGHPTLITRCGMQDELPISIETVGGLYKEAEILRVGLAFEQATKWHKQWPDMSKIV